MQKRRLDEGLRAGDLEDLVLPLLSIDEFESKIDPKAVVVGFYVNDHDAAVDLNRFIQKSPVDILDCDISPAPDQHGYFMVFVEVLNNARMADNVAAVVEEVAALTNIENWKAQIRGVDGLVVFDKDTLAEKLQHDKESIQESILHFLTRSALQNASVNGQEIILESPRTSWSGNIVGFGAVADVLREHRLVGRPMALGFSDVSASERLAALLGEGWCAYRIDDVDIVFRSDEPERVLVLRA